jgi:hypothetical protein
VAREFARQLDPIVADRDRPANMAREITCVWCGHQFVTKLKSQAEELHEHAKVCERHPVRKAEAERDRANFLLRNAESVLQLCWRDLGEWVQFGRYNAEGIIPGSGEGKRPGPLPDPPQRPTVAGVNHTDQNITVVEEALGWIRKHLGAASEDDPLPEDLRRRTFDWLAANQITEPHKYRWGLFPLGMVGRWIERAEQAEAERSKLAAFKQYVHGRLDQAGVPHHPPGPHGAEGCRIGDRLDWLTGRLGRLGSCPPGVEDSPKWPTAKPQPRWSGELGGEG